MPGMALPSAPAGPPPPPPPQQPMPAGLPNNQFRPPSLQPQLVMPAGLQGQASCPPGLQQLGQPMQPPQSLVSPMLSQTAPSVQGIQSQGPLPGETPGLTTRWGLGEPPREANPCASNGPAAPPNGFQPFAQPGGSPNGCTGFQKGMAAPGAMPFPNSALPP